MTAGGHTRLNPNYGRGEHLLAPDELEHISPEEIAQRLESALKDSSYSPPLLPTVALEVVALSRDPKVDFAHIRKLIESDPLLAGKVIQLAQSSFYSRSTPIRSLDDALVRLGTRTLGDLFLQVAVTTRVFRAKGYEEPMNAIRRHCIAAAHLSRKICQKTGFPEEYAFLCGLLHDCGMAASLIILADTPRSQTPPSFQSVSWAIESVHALASEVLSKAWRLPPDIQFALRHHHQFIVQGRLHPLLVAICVADMIAGDVGLAAGQESDPSFGAQAAHAAGLGKTELTTLRDQGKEIAELLA